MKFNVIHTLMMKKNYMKNLFQIIYEQIKNGEQLNSVSNVTKSVDE